MKEEASRCIEDEEWDMGPEDIFAIPINQQPKKYALSKEQKLIRDFSTVSKEERQLFQKMQPYDINSELTSKLNIQKKYC